MIVCTRCLVEGDLFSGFLMTRDPCERCGTNGYERATADPDGRFPEFECCLVRAKTVPPPEGPTG